MLLALQGDLSDPSYSGRSMFCASQRFTRNGMPQPLDNTWLPKTRSASNPKGLLLSHEAVIRPLASICDRVPMSKQTDVQLFPSLIDREKSEVSDLKKSKQNKNRNLLCRDKIPCPSVPPAGGYSAEPSVQTVGPGGRSLGLTSSACFGGLAGLGLMGLTADGFGLRWASA